METRRNSGTSTAGRVARGLLALTTLAAALLYSWVAIRVLIFLFGGLLLLPAWGVGVTVHEHARAIVRRLTERTHPASQAPWDGPAEIPARLFLIALLMLGGVLITFFAGALMLFAIKGHTLTLPWGQPLEPWDMDP